MKWRWSAFFVSLFAGLAIYAGHGRGGDRPSLPDGTDPDTIPLDGRGGGIIAYAREPVGWQGIHELFAINADGTGERKIISALIGLNHHDWSPDGLRLAAVGYVSDDTWPIHVLDADGGSLRRLTWQEGVWDVEPSWSPDGATIAFSRIYPAEDDRAEIWVMNADGTGQRWLGIPGFAPKWSPDGARLIYATGLRGPSDLYTSASDGTDVQRLTSTPSDETQPSWSPDGSQVVFITDQDGNREVYVMDSDGTDWRRLTENLVPEFVARWSPDGSMITFDSGLAGGNHWEVYVVGADGAGLRRVTNTPGTVTAVNPVWRPTPR